MQPGLYTSNPITFSQFWILQNYPWRQLNVLTTLGANVKLLLPGHSLQFNCKIFYLLCTETFFFFFWYRNCFTLEQTNKICTFSKGILYPESIVTSFTSEIFSFIVQGKILSKYLIPVSRRNLLQSGVGIQYFISFILFQWKVLSLKKMCV